ncbi:MAG: PilZ domain-containing protein [Pseudomonadota bacterium]
MTEENKRRHARIRSLNLSHVFATEDGNAAVQGMGRTLNLSESGMLLETTFDVPMGDPLVITLGLEDELLELKGYAVYSKPMGAGKYETGIEFATVETDSYPKLKWFIHALSGKGTPNE